MTLSLPRTTAISQRRPLDFLVNEICINLDRDEIGADAAGLIEHAQQIAGILSGASSQASGDDDRTDGGEGHEDIYADCLTLIRCFSELVDPPIEQIAHAIPSLVKYLDYHSEFQEAAVISLKNILTKGTRHQREMVIDAQPIPKNLSGCYSRPTISL